MRQAACALLLCLAGPASAAQVVPAMPPLAVSPQVPGTKVLLLRLSLRMDRIDQEYALMTPAERNRQLAGAEDLLNQLHARTLDSREQHSVFKIEMRIRALRRDLKRETP